MSEPSTHKPRFSDVFFNERLHERLPVTVEVQILYTPLLLVEI